MLVWNTLISHPLQSPILFLFIFSRLAKQSLDQKKTLPALLCWFYHNKIYFTFFKASITILLGVKLWDILGYDPWCNSHIPNHWHIEHIVYKVCIQKILLLKDKNDLFNAPGKLDVLKLWYSCCTRLCLVIDYGPCLHTDWPTSIKLAF